MYLWIDRNKYGHETLYVKKTFRKPDGGTCSKTIENLGRLSDLSKIHEDPIAWAKSYIEELNRKEKENHQAISIKFEPSKIIEKDDKRLYDGGYLFLQKIYHELRLDYICKKIKEKYKFEYDLSEILSYLVYGRVLYPMSKCSTYDYSSRLLEKPSFSLQDIYRALDVIADENEYIQSSMYKFSKDLGKRNDKILYYDCTNYYFEIEEERGICKYGDSKENRPNPIVQMGLFMDSDGIPLAFCLSPGNTNEQKTLIPLEQEIINDFKNSKLVVCTDAGLSSVTNRKFNDKEDRAFITTQSIKKMKKFQKEWALSPKGWHLSNERSIFNLDEVLSEDSLKSKFYDRIFYKEEWFKEDGMEQKFIVTFSLKYRDYMRKIREEQIIRAKKVVDSHGNTERIRQNDYKRFITKTSVTKAGEIAENNVLTLNDDRIHEEEQYDGFYAVATNLDDSPEAIIEVNKGRWEIEESFRIMKTEFEARPVFLRKDNRILAHFSTCFIALTVFRYLEKKLQGKYTCSSIINGLNDIKFLKFPDDGYVPAYTRNDFTDDLHNIFGFRTDYQIITNASMRKIISETKKK